MRDVRLRILVNFYNDILMRVKRQRQEGREGRERRKETRKIVWYIEKKNNNFNNICIRLKCDKENSKAGRGDEVNILPASLSGHGIHNYYIEGRPSLLVKREGLLKNV